MGFLNDLSSSLNSSLGLADNKPGNLDSDNIGDYGRLGDFASKIDKSAHRSYIEDGVIRNIRPRALSIISQEPDMTIVIKKRAFASLKENHKADLLDEDELLFLRATKALFENKCKAIAAYERLSKYGRIASKNGGIISDYILPGVLGAADSLNALAPGIIDASMQSTLDTIKRVKAFSDPNFFTTWIRDDGLPFSSPTGDGPGTFELTTVSGISASNSTGFGQGKATITVEDPYRLMVVSNNDIDKAISDAKSVFKQKNFFRVTEFQLEQSISDLKTRLGQIRAQTGASQINFLMSEDTVLYKKVRAIIERTGREIIFTFDAGILGSSLFAFDNSVVSLGDDARRGQEGLQGAEVDLFKQIIQNIYILMGLQQTTRSEIKNFNKETNSVRKKMRLHYANKAIIQPMDVVTIFISSKTSIDTLISQGLQINYANSLLGALDNTVGNLESAYDDIKNTFNGGTAGGSYLENERNAIAGPDFPLWLYGLLRNDFTRQSAGTCVFNGMIKSSSHSYSGGKYVLSVSAEDNCNYFDKGQININPSLDVYNSAIYDPLSPFKSSFDESSGLQRGEVPELLDANKRLLNSGSVRAKLGSNKGQPVDEKLFDKMDIEPIASPNSNNPKDFGKRFRRKFTNPDGFVYRWKTGIGSLTLWGEPYSDLTSLGSMQSESAPSITQDPFAGQDTMNVLSLLITGQPYNFNTFMRGALQNGQLRRDDLFNEVASASFFKSLVSDATRQNSIWGNFIPFKNLVVNERQYQLLATGEFDLITKNDRLNKLLSDRAEAFDLVAKSYKQFQNTPMFYTVDAKGVADKSDAEKGGISELTETIKKLDADIEKEMKDFQNSKNLANGNGTLSISGDDISFDPTFTKSDDPVNETKRKMERAEFRKKINGLTLRRLWSVKANEDNNLFIVDDTYDKNYDIQQFERSLSGKMENWKSNYVSVFSQIEGIKSLLGLEVFADSQGHIRARPPQYNRMPTSVFRNMLQDKVDKGIKIFPDYLEGLFFNQVKGITDQIEIVEDEIRLYAAGLGKNNDSEAQKLIGGKFVFLTREESGRFGSKDMRSLMSQNEPDLTEDVDKKVLEPLAEEINLRLNATINFDAIKRANLTVNQKLFTGVAEQDIITKISDRIRQKTQQNSVPSSVRDIMSNTRLKGNGRSQADILRVLNQISMYVAERQRLMKKLKPVIANLREGLAVNSTKDLDAGTSLLYSNFQNPEKIFPELLEGMIEDENDHDLGPGSGSRYVISDDTIINITVSENAPPYSFVQVDGRLGQGIVSLDSGMEVSNGGNPMVTAWSVDYDMWNMYGFKSGGPVTLPFFDDPNSQCAPYGVYLLNLARQQIFTASCTVIGNEFMQAGEVYYVESYDLLFYATSVTHNLTYNGSYTTTLELTFGHNPGEYIPTQLDIIGKGLYSNSHRADLVRNVRHDRGDNTVHLTVVLRDTGFGTLLDFKNVENLIQGRFGDQNKKNLSNMLLAISGLLTPTNVSQVLSIELRIYENKNPSINMPYSKDLKRVAESVKDWVANPQKVNLENPKSMLPESNVETNVDTSKIIIKIVDLDAQKTNETYSPSSPAWAMARHFVNAAGISSSTADGTETVEQKELSNRELKMLIESVIDVWIVFSTPAAIVSETSK